MAVQRLRRCPYCLQYYDARDDICDDLADQPIVAASRFNGHLRALTNPAPGMSWLRPVGVSVAMLGCSGWVIAWHQDVGAVFAAAIFLLLAAQSWLAWRRRARRGRGAPRS